MLRLPSPAELRSLFWRPTKVSHAIAGIETAAKHAESVAAHNDDAHAATLDKAASLQERANAAYDKAEDHQAEARRAQRVAAKLHALVA